MVRSPAAASTGRTRSRRYLDDSVGGGRPVSDTITNKAHIMVVDDTLANLRFLVEVLKRHDYIARPIPNGKQALLSAQTAPPDVILLDIMMPGMDGYEVCEQLKADPRTRDIPVIFLSALYQTADKIKAFEVGGVDFITKPFQIEEVIARVDTHLTLRNLQKQLKENNELLRQEIDERKRMEEQLRKQARELETRNEELDAFSHTVAHDLKEPLAVLLGYSEVLEVAYTRVSKAELDACLQGIARSALKMGSIISELLLLASVRQMDDVAVTILEMGDYIEDIKIRLGDMIKTRAVEIHVPESWPVAWGHGPWIEEVWVNYISNAIKYGGHPPRVELGATGLIDGMVQFWVRDNGPGLTNEEQERLFTPFTRLNQIRAKGHGLGLSIVRRIVEKLGGEVGVESEVGRGSVFYFTLPAEQRSGQPGADTPSDESS